MRSGERCCLGRADTGNRSSNDFFSLAAGDDVLVCVSPISPVFDERDSRRTSSRTESAAAARLSPDASFDFRFDSDGRQPAFFSPRTAPKTTFFGCIGSTTDVGGGLVGHGDDGISTSNAMDYSRNVGERKISSPVASAFVKAGDNFSQLWPCSAPTSEETPRFDAAQQPHCLASVDLDDAVWALLKGQHTSTHPTAVAAAAAAPPTPTAAPADGGVPHSSSVSPRSPRAVPDFCPLSPVATLQLPQLVSSPLAAAISPSPQMSLARPSASASATKAQHDTLAAAANTNANDNRFSMVLGEESPQAPDARPRLPSFSYLRFMPAAEQSFVPDDVWECSVSDTNCIRAAGGGCGGVRSSSSSPRASRSLSLETSPRMSNLKQRLSVYGDNKGEGRTSNSPTQHVEVGAVTPVRALFEHRYFDGVLPLMLQCGDAMLQARQRRDRYGEAAHSTDNMRTGVSGTSDNASYLEAYEAGVEGGDSDFNLGDVGAVPTFSSPPLPSGTTATWFDAVQARSHSTSFDSASSAMRQVEELMVALGVVPGSSSDDTEDEPEEEEEEKNPSCDALLLSAPSTGSTAGHPAAEAVTAANDKKTRLASSSSHNVALPRLTNEVRSSVRLQAAAAAAAVGGPVSPSATAAPLPTWNAPPTPQDNRTEPTTSHDAVRKPAVDAARPSVAHQPAVPVRSHAVPTESPHLRNPVPAERHDISPSHLQQLQAQQRDQKQRPQSIAEMLRARAAPAGHASPYVLLVKDDGGSGHEASLPMQRSPRAPEHLSARQCVMESERAGYVSAAAGPDAGVTPSVTAAEMDWQATEHVSFAVAADCTTSRTVPTMAHLVARGCNVCLASLHARRSRSTTFTSWGSLLPEFFTSFFQSLLSAETAVSTHAVSLSVALLKCDLYRDLLSNAVRLSPVVLLGTPLLGARLKGLTAFSVWSAEDCCRVLATAHERLSSDDHLNGSIVITLTLKQQEVDAATGKPRDVVLSSFTAFAANADVYSDVLQAERLPATAGLLLQLFRGPVQAAVSVCTSHLHHNPAELRRAGVVQRVLRSRATLPPRVGSVMRLLAHIRRELRNFWTVLEASKARAAEQRRVLAAGGAVTSSATAAGEAVALFEREREQRAELRYALRALTCLRSDCKAVLADPVSKLPPLYVLSPRTTGGATSAAQAVDPQSGGGSHDCDGRAGASLAQRRAKKQNGEAWEVASEGSDPSAGVLPLARTRAGPLPARDRNNRLYNKTTAAATSGSGGKSNTLRWNAAVPLPNLFAGDAACGWRGIRPLFRLSDPLLREAFQSVDPPAKPGTMQAVVFLETQEADAHRYSSLGDDDAAGRNGGDGGTTLRRDALQSGRSRSGAEAFAVNGVPVGSARLLPGMPHLEVHEVCLHNSGGPTDGDVSRPTSREPMTPPSGERSGLWRAPFGSSPPVLELSSSSSSGGVNSGASATIRAAFRDFLEGRNVSILSVTESSAEADAVTRMVRSPLWLAMREMVEAALQGSHSAALPSGSSSTTPLTRQTLYMSITQPLSIDCVKDHLGGDAAAVEGASVCPNRLLSAPNAEEVMAFQAAWTPAGPVVAGARYIPITSVAQFCKVTRELPRHVRAVAEARRTESLGGTHVLVSFVLRQCRAPPPSSLAESQPQSPLPQAAHAPLAASAATHVFLTSATVLLSTEAMFWNTLRLDDYVPPSHPLNILRPTFCHRVVNVVDVAASALDRAWPLLLTQERMTKSRRFTLWQVPWSMQAYAAYLGRHRAALRWCMTHLTARTQTAVVATACSKRQAAPPQRVRPHVDLQRADLPDWVRGHFYGKRVWLADLAAAVRQVELMFAVAADLTENCGVWTDECGVSGRPMALLGRHTVYDLTAPPTAYVRTPLDPLPASAEEPPAALLPRPNPSPPSVRRSESDTHPLLQTLRTGQARTPVSPREPKPLTAPRRGPQLPEEPSELALRCFVQKHGVSQAQRRCDRRANEATAAAPPAAEEKVARPPSRLLECPAVPTALDRRNKIESDGQGTAHRNISTAVKNVDVLLAEAKQRELVPAPPGVLTAPSPSQWAIGPRRPTSSTTRGSAGLRNTLTTTTTATAATFCSTQSTYPTQGLSSQLGTIPASVLQDSIGSRALRSSTLTVATEMDRTPLVMAAALPLARRPPNRVYAGGGGGGGVPVSMASAAAPPLRRGVAPLLRAGTLPSVPSPRHLPVVLRTSEPTASGCAPPPSTGTAAAVSATLACAKPVSRPRSATSAAVKPLASPVPHLPPFRARRSESFS